MRDTIAVVLTAGKSTRMNSSFSKVLHKIYGKTMISYVLDKIRDLGIKRIVIITNGKDELKRQCKFGRGVQFVIQKRLLGTAHAVSKTREVLSGFEGDLLVLYGDTPLLTMHTLKRLLDKHKGSLAACTLLTSMPKEPTGYGRIVRDADDKIIKIVEEKDASTYERAIEEVNAGVYCFRSKELFGIIDDISNDNRKGEYYLTDAIGIFAKSGFGIESVQADDFGETIGVNSRQELARAQEIARNRILYGMMSKGVGIIDPATTHIYNEVQIGQDTIIYPFTVIESDVKIGKKCKIGPFSRIRPETEIKDEVEIGNFTEIVRCKIGEKTKIKHRTFLGDASIGRNVNIGAGTVTANYDGKKTNKTRIDDNAFIGSGTIIIAPATIGEGAFTGAGSVITKGSNISSKSVVFGVPAEVQKRKKARNLLKKAH